MPEAAAASAVQVRVLAARDPHGGIELAQAKAPDGSLVIASGHFLPEGCTNLQEVRLPLRVSRCMLVLPKVAVSQRCHVFQCAGSPTSSDA